MKSSHMWNTAGGGRGVVELSAEGNGHQALILDSDSQSRWDTFDTLVLSIGLHTPKLCPHSLLRSQSYSGLCCNRTPRRKTSNT
jgi:hypothetical protein